MGISIRKAIVQAAAVLAVSATACGLVGGGTAQASSPARYSGASSTQSTADWPVLKNGRRGTDVTTAQHLLTAQGHKTTADGIYGSATAEAVAAFQREQRLDADGIVGPATWSRLLIIVKQGADGSAVRAVQAQLADQGYKITVDGVFGPATAEAVASFQRAHRLTADAIVGPDTWAALITGNSAAGSPPPSTGDTLTHDQATDRLRDAGIDWQSTGNCSNRTKPTCTSFDGIRVRSIDGIIAFKENSGCSVTITGATEAGHASRRRESHANGYKIDIRLGDCVNSYIEDNATRSYYRGDAWVWKGKLDGAPVDYARESDHWDITFH